MKYYNLNVGKVTANYLTRMKLKFMIRLDKNEFIKQNYSTLDEINFENSYTTQIASHMKLKDYEYDTLLTIVLHGLTLIAKIGCPQL
jgi:hypothetical protein